MRYRMKPVEVDAFRLGLKGKPTPAPAWFGSPDPSKITDDGIYIPTVMGDVLARWGDWITRNSKGQIFPYSPLFFEAIYEPA